MSELPDVHKMTEPELIELSTSLSSAIEPLGELAMDEYMKRRGEVIDRAIASRALEESISGKFAHLSNEALVGRMNRAPDFGYDDEAVELTRRLKLGGAAWRWSADFFNPKIEIYQTEPQAGV